LELDSGNLERKARVRRVSGLTNRSIIRGYGVPASAEQQVARGEVWREDKEAKGGEQMEWLFQRKLEEDG
jgi:hypothetical protein